MSRMTSSRLPGKALLKIKGKPALQHIIERAKLVSVADLVILATSTDKKDDVLERLAKKNKIEVFRGSLVDVLDRFLGAAHKFSLDYFAVYTADNLFCDPGLINLGLRQIVKDKLDFINTPDDLVCGGSAYCISTKALERLCELKSNENTELYQDYFLTARGLKIADLKVADPIFHNTNARVTLDYPEDLKFFRKVFERMDIKTNDIPLKKILQFLKQNPEIAQINLFRHADWFQKQEHIREVLKKNKFKNSNS